MHSDTFDQKKFEKDLGAAIDEFNEGRSGTFEANSSYDEQAGKFTVEKARSNEKLNREHVIKYAELELASLAETVDLSKLGNDAYEPLNGTLTDDQIQAACDAANNFLGVNVTLKLNGEDAGKVDGSSVLQWISFADPANPTLDTSQISSWAAELANGFNTVGSTRWWTRADGKECAVEGGDFGWSIDSDTLAKQVEDAINNKQTGDIEIKYSQKADTFTAKESPTGRHTSTSTCPSSTRATMTRTVISSGRPTLFPANRAKTPPRGRVADQQQRRRQHLIRAKDPETGKPKYESPVSYWMPFEGNMIGFHDATWQNDKSFDNAESYKWCGSHGCINLRLADAKALHDCKVGLCVVVHS
ncbi:MAG: L,D-transpeptidase [Collinsella sp.]